MKRLQGKNSSCVCCVLYPAKEGVLDSDRNRRKIEKENIFVSMFSEYVYEGGKKG